MFCKFCILLTFLIETRLIAAVLHSKCECYSLLCEYTTYKSCAYPKDNQDFFRVSMDIFFCYKFVVFFVVVTFSSIIKVKKKPQISNDFQRKNDGFLGRLSPQKTLFPRACRNGNPHQQNEKINSTITINLQFGVCCIVFNGCYCIRNS